MPFVDVTVVDASENPTGCPASHPEELIFEVWPGTTGMCDCLERQEDRDYFLYIKCIRGEDAPHNSPDCFDIPGKQAVIQNVVKGARYCGKRGGVAFKDAIRPQF